MFDVNEQSYMKVSSTALWALISESSLAPCYRSASENLILQTSLRRTSSNPVANSSTLSVYKEISYLPAKLSSNERFDDHTRAIEERYFYIDVPPESANLQYNNFTLFLNASRNGVLVGVCIWNGGCVNWNGNCKYSANIDLLHKELNYQIPHIGDGRWYAKLRFNPLLDIPFSVKYSVLGIPETIGGQTKKVDYYIVAVIGSFVVAAVIGIFIYLMHKNVLSIFNGYQAVPVN